MGQNKQSNVFASLAGFPDLTVALLSTESWSIFKSCFLLERWKESQQTNTARCKSENLSPMFLLLKLLKLQLLSGRAKTYTLWH